MSNSIWELYTKEQRKEYIDFLKVYAALSNLFRQKKGKPIPYLDSKFQETVYSRAFKAENVDRANTPHDVLSEFGTKRVGIGLKTWMDSKPSFQKVMQLKRFQTKINSFKNNEEELAYVISCLKNEKMIRDYNRLGLSEDENIYHYITRDKGSFTINECSYPLIDIDNLRNFNKTDTAFSWSDEKKDYKYTFGDSQIWQKFDSNKYNTIRIKKFDVDIIDDPFSFLMKSYFEFFKNAKKQKEEIIEAFLPLYSFGSKEVEKKSGLNAWNAAPKSKGTNKPRPLNEIYIPIPREFHKKNPDFFVKNIFSFEERQKRFSGDKNNKPKIRFHLKLPNGKKIPGLITQDNSKALQSGSNSEVDKNGIRYGQSALGQWLLIDVLGLKERKLVTKEWLDSKGTDSIRLWRKKEDYSIINIDFSEIDSFENFMRD